MCQQISNDNDSVSHSWAIIFSCGSPSINHVTHGYSPPKDIHHCCSVMLAYSGNVGIQQPYRWVEGLWSRRYWALNQTSPASRQSPIAVGYYAPQSDYNDSWTLANFENWASNPHALFSCTVRQMV